MDSSEYLMVVPLNGMTDLGRSRALRILFRQDRPRSATRPTVSYFMTLLGSRRFTDFRKLKGSVRFHRPCTEVTELWAAYGGPQ